MNCWPRIFAVSMVSGSFVSTVFQSMWDAGEVRPFLSSSARTSFGDALEEPRELDFLEADGRHLLQRAGEVFLHQARAPNRAAGRWRRVSSARTRMTGLPMRPRLRAWSGRRCVGSCGYRSADLRGSSSPGDGSHGSAVAWLDTRRPAREWPFICKERRGSTRRHEVLEDDTKKSGVVARRPQAGVGWRRGQGR